MSSSLSSQPSSTGERRRVFRLLPRRSRSPSSSSKSSYLLKPIPFIPTPRSPSQTTTDGTPSVNYSSVESIDPSKPPSSIMDVLAPDAVSLDELDERYHSILCLVKSLIGVVSNCDGIMEIFPPAFVTYNILVPNLLNVPFLTLGIAAPADLVSLAVYYGARSSQCAYCSLHTCTFALRRGVDEDALTGNRSFSKREAAVVEAALNMSSFPNHLVEEDRRALFQQLSPANVEWIVLAVSMIGYLTTFMSALGTDMEQGAIEESAQLLRSAGWTEGKHEVTSPEGYLQVADKDPQRGDSFISNIKLIPYIPSAIKYDMSHLKKIPNSWPAIGDFLNTHVGHSFPILGLLNHSRATRAIAETIRLNLDAIVCGIEPDTKYLIGIVFAGVNRNRLMAKEFRKMTMMMVDYFDDDTINAVYEFSKEETDFSVDFMSALTDSALMDTPLSETQVRFLYIAKACSFAPTRTSQAVVDACKPLRSDNTVELLNWVSLLSLLQKLYIFYYPSCSEIPSLKNAQLEERAPKFTKIPPVAPNLE